MAGAAVTAVSFDDQDHIWLLTRPQNLPNATPKSAIPPAVLEFDSAGKFLQGLGGESRPGYAWPADEHGLSINGASHNAFCAVRLTFKGYSVATTCCQSEGVHANP